MKKKVIMAGAFIIIIFVIGYFLFIHKQNADINRSIKIGVVMPQTGFLAQPGKGVLTGVHLAIDIFNEKHPKKKIELIIEDSKSEPKFGVNALTKLINVDKVKIVIADISSSVLLAMAPIAERNRVVLFSPGGSNPKVREAGDYIFRNYPSDDFDGTVMANYLLKEKNIRNCAVFNFNNDYGIGLKAAFQKEYEKLGGKIIITEMFDENNLQFANIIQKSKQRNLEAIYFIGSPKQSAYFIIQCRELNYDVKVYGNLAFEDNEFIKIAKNAFDTITYSAPYYDPNSDAEIVKSFVEKYELKYGKKPDLTAALGYDVAAILGKAIVNADYNQDKVKDQLYKIKNYNGITGNTSFDDKGDVLKDVLIKEITGTGETHTVEVYKLN